MTSISLTSGQLLDIVSALEIKEDRAYDSGDRQLAIYYMELANQFNRIYDRLQDKVPEHRTAELVLAA